MMVYILLLSSVAAICIIADAQLHPIQTQDLHEIVQSVKTDVNRHLKMTSADRRIESVSLPDPPELPKAAVVGDIDDFMNMIQESMHHHLIRNLGPPSDAENGASTVYSKPATEKTIGGSIEYTPDYPPELPSTSPDEGTPVSSSEVYETRVGSAKGIPGVHFPDYKDIPRTSFTCSDKPHFPGFYADQDTGCQVFHVCWPDRRESFLCPMGTIFNQALLVCDYFYNSNCSLAPYYYSMNSETESDPAKSESENTISMINILLEKTDSASTSKPDILTDGHLTADSVLSFVSQFMPIKAKIAIYPETASRRQKIVASASIGESNKDSKSKSRPKRIPVTSKPLSVPPSDMHAKSPTTDNRMAELKSKIFAVKLTEALDRILIDVKSDDSLSKLLWYVDNTVKFLKDHLEDYARGLSDPESFEPGSEMYEYDLATTEAFERLPVVFKNILINISTFMDEVESRMRVPKPGIPHEVQKPAALTHLNPRFIVKPAVKQTAEIQEQLTPVNNELKRATTVEDSFKLNIYPDTKKALLKNYVKLFKTKCA